MPAYIIAMLHQHVDYVKTVYNSSVCFRPIYLATSPSDEGETCHFAVYLEDYTLDHGIKRNNKPERPRDRGHNTA